jgi:hypothetical protein
VQDDDDRPGRRRDAGRAAGRADARGDRQEAQHEASCKGCHALIDPPGIGFVRFDQTGRYDATIDGSEYGVAAALPDAVASPGFNTLGELAAKLQAMPEVSACLATKVFVYAEGRDPVRADTCALESASKTFADNGNSFSAMLRGWWPAPPSAAGARGGTP